MAWEADDSRHECAGYGASLDDLPDFIRRLVSDNLFGPAV